MLGMEEFPQLANSEMSRCEGEVKSEISRSEGYGGRGRGGGESQFVDDA